MVGQMLGEDDKGHRRIGYKYCQQVGAGHAAPVRLGEGELRQGDEGADMVQRFIVDDHKSVVSGVLADQGKDGSDKIARQDPDDEGDQFDHVLAVGGAEHGHRQCHQAADQRDIHRAAFHIAAHQVADGVARKAQSDDGNGGSDDDRGHQLVDPLDTAEFDDQRDDDIDQARDQGAEDQACITDGDGGRTAEGGEHGTDEGEGRAKEHRAGALGEEQIHDGADARAEQGRRSAHAVADDRRNRDGRRHDGKKLLQSKEDDLSEFRFVFDTVDEIHTFSLLLFSVCLLFL